MIADPRPDFAQFGNQFNFLTDRKGALNVNYLFDYEDLPALYAFLSERLKVPVETKRENVSPRFDVQLSPETEKKLRHAYAREFALYDELKAAGGRLERL